MNNIVGICSVDATWTQPGALYGSMSTATCKTIYAALLTAKQAGTNISALTLDGDALPATCSSFTPWTNVNLRHFVN